MDEIQLGSSAQSHAAWLQPETAMRTAGSWCPVKTAEGQAEIRQRNRRLTQRQRTLLVLVDGRRSAEQVKALALQAGATDTAFDELLDLGLIAAPPTEAPIWESSDAGLAVVPMVDPVAEPTASDAAPSETSSPWADVVASIPDTATESPASDAAPNDTSPPWVDVAASMPDPVAESPASEAAPSETSFLSADVLFPAPSDDLEPAAAMQEAQDSGAVDSASASEADLFEPSEPDSGGMAEQSVRTTPRRADSIFGSLLPFIESALGGLGPDDSPITSDNALEEARRTLVREIRSKAPLAGSFTLAKLRRARTREELVALFDEVDSHISKPMRHLSARQTLMHVRSLLTGDAVGQPNSPA